MTGQLLGGLLAAALVLPLYGFGQFGSVFDTSVLSWVGIQVPHRFQQVKESFSAAARPGDETSLLTSCLKLPLMLRCSV